MQSLIISAAVFLSLALAPAASGQALGDVAKKEESRRKAAAKPGKVYTNDDLRPSDGVTAPPAPAAPAASAPASSAQPKPEEKTSDEQLSDLEDEARRAGVPPGWLR
jgi:hypothetical protein